MELEVSVTVETLEAEVAVEVDLEQVLDIREHMDNQDQDQDNQDWPNQDHPNNLLAMADNTQHSNLDNLVREQLVHQEQHLVHLAQLAQQDLDSTHLHHPIVKVETIDLSRIWFIIINTKILIYLILSYTEDIMLNVSVRLFLSSFLPNLPQPTW